MRWMDYYGHEKTGNEYLTGVYTKKQKKGNRKWFCCCHLCAILEMYAMNRDRLKLLRQRLRFVATFYTTSKQFCRCFHSKQQFGFNYNVCGNSTEKTIIRIA